MATETVLTNTALSGEHSALGTGTLKAFLVVHPVGVTVVSGILVGVGVYYLMKKSLKKKELISSGKK